MEMGKCFTLKFHPNQWFIDVQKRNYFVMEMHLFMETQLKPNPVIKNCL